MWGKGDPRAAYQDHHHLHPRGRPARRLGGRVAAQDEADALQLVTEEVEPGVERIINDGAGHDLDEKHPTNRYDMDDIAVLPDGTVWLSSSYSGRDNQKGVGALVWALGQPGILDAGDGSQLVALQDGSILAIGDQEVTRFDGEAFVPDDGPLTRRLLGGGSLWLIKPDDLMGIVPEGESVVGPIGVLPAVWNGWFWQTAWQSGRDADAQSHFCSTGGSGIACEDRLGNVTRYLQGTDISQIAAGPDNTVWAVGGYNRGNGGLYRITPE